MSSVELGKREDDGAWRALVGVRQLTALRRSLNAIAMSACQLRNMMRCVQLQQGIAQRSGVRNHVAPQQSWTWWTQFAMSALPPKADIG
jgi:hypothetical protein